MAILPTKKIGSMIDDKKKSKGKDFMNGLKEWITSPGGIITIVLLIGVIWYAHSKFEHAKPAKG